MHYAVAYQPDKHGLRCLYTLKSACVIVLIGLETELHKKKTCDIKRFYKTDMQTYLHILILGFLTAVLMAIKYSRAIFDDKDSPNCWTLPK
jgi:hypothetical protein